MTRLALPKLPDRDPVKRTIVCEPELNKALERYALLYRETYGEAESVETLVPFMLATFLAKDRAFAAFRKAGIQGAKDQGPAAGDAPPRPARLSPAPSANDRTARS